MYFYLRDRDWLSEAALLVGLLLKFPGELGLYQVKGRSWEFNPFSPMSSQDTIT